MMKALFAAVMAVCAFGASGEASPGAVRAARSVHFWYDTPPRETVTGAQATVTVRETVPGTYFCALCFNMGYCGFQELYDGKRVFIFSVWDPGDPFDFAANPDAVKDERRVKCLFSREGMEIGRFGGEGTGGGVGFAITGVSGASAVFWGGVISYDNSAKRDVLGVPEEVLATKGAVSSECAAAMAEGARRLLKTDLAVSLTGIAGPGGGSAEKPVGLVWFGLASGGPRLKESVVTEKMVFPGGREAVRAAAIDHAIAMLLSAADGARVESGKGRA